jgi:hypothetical protein
MHLHPWPARALQDRWQIMKSLVIRTLFLLHIAPCAACLTSPSGELGADEHGSVVDPDAALRPDASVDAASEPARDAAPSPVEDGSITADAGSDAAALDGGWTDDAQDGSVDGAAGSVDGAAGDDAGPVEVDASVLEDAATAPSLYAPAYTVLQKRCAFCHVGGGIGMSWGLLDLSTPARAHASLVDRPAAGKSCGSYGGTLVVPGDPRASLLVQKLEGTHDCGVRMPDKFPALRRAEIAPIRAWIEAGAPLDDGSTPHEPEPELAAPELLSETGLFSDFARRTLAAGVSAYDVQWPLWSDGASKRRWVRLPPGSRIDTSNMDYWVYPVGTKLWKEFAVDGEPVETRLLHKVAGGRWVMAAYLWERDGSEAYLVPDGVSGANGTGHDIPDRQACAGCHDHVTDKVLGFSALQLSHDRGGETLASLAAADKLTHEPAAPLRLPGDSYAQQALGLMHANCGHCHNPASEVYRLLRARSPRNPGPDLWERSDALRSVEATYGYRSTVNRPNGILPGLVVIAPGDPEQSLLVLRMRDRGLGTLQMPTLGTNLVDTAGVEAVERWIRSLSGSD